MPTDTQIELMCNIGEGRELKNPADAEALVAEGYVEKKQDRYKLTGKGTQFITSRGAGLNEA